MTPNDIQETSKSLTAVFEAIGYWEVILLALLIYVGFMLWQLFKRYLTRKDREFADKKTLDKIRIQKDTIKINVELTKLCLKFVSFQTTILEKLDTSASLFTHGKLTRKFLGLDRSFYSTSKLRILRFYEAETKENTYSLKTEIQDVLYDKVLSELSLHTFKDETILNQTTKLCNEQIDEFFIKLAEINKDKVKEYINIELYNLTVDLSTTIDVAYRTLVHTDEQIKYLIGIK